MDESGNPGAVSNVLFLDGPDEDEDGVYDVDEQNCGGDALNPAIRPERIDGAFAGVDDDGDGLIDEPLPAASDPFDCDGDGFKGVVENFVYSPVTTGDQDLCGGGSAPGPADLVAQGASFNRLNLSDVSNFRFPVNRVSQGPNDAGYDRRWDLDASAFINLTDVNLLNTLKPPMHGGQRAFTKACPWPP